jgi:urea transport system permease protein
MRHRTFLLWLLLLLPLPLMANDFEDALQQLTSRNFSQVIAAVEALGGSGNPQAKPILEAMLAGELQVRKRDNRFVLAERDGRNYRLRDALSNELLEESASRRTLRKIRVNNSVRSTIRGALARLALDDPDPAERRNAAQALSDGDPALNEPLLKQALASETDARVRDALRFSLAKLQLQHSDAQIRLRSVDELSGSLQPEVRVLLTQALAKNSDGTWREPDPDIRARMQRALTEMEFWQDVNTAAETLFFGVSLGSVLLLAAIGLAVTFGVMGVINMAHGEMIMLGAYTTFVVQQLMPQSVEYSLLLAIPAAFVVSGCVGMLLERTVIRLLYGRPLETLLATFGVSLFLQQTVRSVFGPLNQSVITPQWMTGALEVNPLLSLTYNRLTIILFVPVVLVALMLLLKRSHFGLEMRAVTQNRSMANAMGIRSDRVDALTFGLGSGIAGVAGVALSQLTNVGPNLGQSYIIDSFMVVVFGGVGNLWGTLVGALSLGLANKLLEPFAGAVAAKILVLVFIILFLQKRPRGLFALKGRFVEA